MCAALTQLSKRANTVAHKGFVWLAIACQSLPVFAQDQVTIVGSLKDAELARDFIAGTLIVGRKRIEDSGVRTVGELLKREPAVTVRDGRISLLNMPGYTQVLVDGQPPQSGRPVTEMNLVHIERIEIIKSSVAQYGPYGIAGTVNLVSRKTLRTTSTTLGAGGIAGRKRSADLWLSHNRSTAGSPFAYSAQLSAERNVESTRTLERQMLGEVGQSERLQWLNRIVDETREPQVALVSNAVWRMDERGTVEFSPELVRVGGGGTQSGSRVFENGDVVFTDELSDSTLQSIALPLKWTIKPSRKSQLELKARGYQASFQTQDTRAVVDGDTREIDRVTKTRAANVDLTFKLTANRAHAIKAGGSFTQIAGNTDYHHRINGADDSSMNKLGIQKRVSHRKHRFFLQDDWRFNERLALALGVAGERQTVVLDQASDRVKADFQVWAPSFHLSRKIDGDGRRQVRFSLARTFKAPTEHQLTQRRILHPLAPCMSNGECPENSMDTADTAGNIHLRAERAIGVNLSYDHGFGESSQVTAEIYTRRIHDKQGEQIVLEYADWAGAPRYVSRPENLGDAHVAGINLGMEVALQDLVETAPDINLRAGLGVAKSRIFSLPGPGNRLEKHVPWTAKIGATYTMQSWPLKLDADIHVRPGVWTRRSLAERIHVPRRTELDLDAVWSFTTFTSLALTFKRAFPGTANELDEYAGPEDMVRLHTSQKKRALLGLRFDTKL